LQNIVYLKPYPTQSNFILCKVVGKDAFALKTKLAEEYGIFIRYFNKAGLKDHIRISVGKPEEMDELVEVLKKL
ncbi:MAG: aminotransferase class I/II-fold pyridoxal phosphate-dependent enzyme, partial [Anaerolineales bacterium]